MKEEDRKIGPEIHCTDLKLSRNLSAHVRKSGVDEVTMMHGWIIRYLYENREQEIYGYESDPINGKEGIRKKRIGKTGCQVKKSNPDRKRDCKPGIF